jgi:hypothetical protein
MLMCTILHKLAGGTPLQQCRMNNVQWKQRARLITGLGTAVMIFILLCTVACGGGGDGSLAKGGINMIVVSGQARIQSGGGNTSVVEGQEAVITTGDQIMADDEAGVKLLLVDGSLLDLKPDTDLQVVTFSAEGMAKLRQLKGRLEVQAASPLLTIEVSTSGSEGFALKTMQFTATPAVRETAFGLWIDGLNAHLTVEAGGVNVTNDDRTETISAGSEVQVSTDGVSPTEAPVGPTAVVVATDDLTPTPTAIAAATPTPEPLFPAPGLIGPSNGDNFKPSDDILLIWGTPPTPLSEDEWYEVQLWREGDVPYTVAQRTKEGTWKVERTYYPGRYQWRILIVRGQEGQRDLSPPSQTWSFSWLSPVVQAPTAPTSLPVSGAVDLTVYLRGTNNAQGLATFSAEHVDAGTIYVEEGTVYGDVAVRIGDTMYHFDKEPAPGEPQQLPAPYRLDVKFSDSLIAATEGIQPGFNPQKAQFWVGTLNCNSAVSEPYRIEMNLYAGGEARKHTEISFLVTDNPLCGVGPGPEEGGGGGEGPPVRP